MYVNMWHAQFVHPCVVFNGVRRQSGFPTFIPCQRQDVNVLPKRRQSHQGDKLCDVSTVPLVARWPVFLARGSDADGEPHYTVPGKCICLKPALIVSLIMTSTVFSCIRGITNGLQSTALDIVHASQEVHTVLLKSAEKCAGQNGHVSREMVC